MFVIKGVPFLDMPSLRFWSLSEGALMIPLCKVFIRSIHDCHYIIKIDWEPLCSHNVFGGRYKLIIECVFLTIVTYCCLILNFAQKVWKYWACERSMQASLWSAFCACMWHCMMHASIVDAIDRNGVLIKGVIPISQRNFWDATDTKPIIPI